MLSFPDGSDNGCTITNERKIGRIGEPFEYGPIQKLPVIDLKQGRIRRII